MPQHSPTTHFTTLDSFRGIAALMVVWFHSALMNGARPLWVAPGNLYVDFFFVLSGFVLTHAYAKRIDEGLGFRAFAWSRLARIWPLHMAMLLVFLIYNTAQFTLDAAGFNVEANPKNTGFAFWCNVVLIHSMGVLDTLSWNYPSWSISVEFWTYLLFFAFVACVTRQRVKSAALLSAGAFGLLVLMSALHKADTILASHDYGILRCITEFFAGMVIYHMRPARILTGADGSQGLRAHLWEIGSLSLGLGLLALADGSKLFEALSLLGFCLIIWVFSQTNGLISRGLNLSAFQFLGRISYSIYMTHALILSICGYALRRGFGWGFTHTTDGARFVDTIWATPLNLVQMGLVVWVSAYTYRWIERPGQRLMSQMSLAHRHAAFEK